MRLKFPDGYKIEPHHHPVAREVTILSGAYLTGYGEVFDERRLKELPPGPELPHFRYGRTTNSLTAASAGPLGLSDKPVSRQLSRCRSGGTYPRDYSVMEDSSHQLSCQETRHLTTSPEIPDV